ncbi:hypothetical protein DICPUDRAFT_30837 [Dictyostelium purpureum]|uniref:Glutamate-rich WD repeat-containing protein 1 n=1 Tax=Dictyostelium purpureum TaxID=5786 RepID=F0ZG39_DICPU|nr:uncharacterized protein DICPUDRAFT_30837 [Dictyostelium purpureum]EGC37091.1 hypothetical protein DICPUDRAFT_30837 [Dictyostelium purpureum]|eukprot:XP_003286372.1 hypothetical protein DICPUDRAFT_30837 [Dictyostelium purpureum]
MVKKRNFGDIEFGDEEINNSGEEDFENDEEIESFEDDEQSLKDEGEEEEEIEMEDGAEEEEGSKKVWRAGVDPLEADEFLDYDSTAYDMMHSMSVEWPCLSFAPIKDSLGAQRKKYPHTMYLVAGTQADEPKNNKIIVMKAKQLHKTKHDEDDSDEDDSEDENSDDEDEDKDADPELEINYINHNGAVNRIRSMDLQSNIVATWSDNRSVYIWNIQNNLNALDSGDIAPKQTLPIHTITNHSIEGYALDWSPKVAGRLATGDCNNNIYITNASGSTWKTDSQAFKGHEASVEDIQWSPSEEKVFASCSVDQTVRIWDTRQHKPALTVKAHSADVNVISWSRNVEYLLVSGCDDGSFRVWDLRQFKDNSPVSDFKYHTGPITSIEWNPYEESQVIVSSSDNQITIWDFSLEEDTEEFTDANDNPDDDFEYPPQLFFIHQGQRDIKEVHWHPQIPHVAISTSIDGFNIFKSSNSEE